MFWFFVPLIIVVLSAVIFALVLAAVIFRPGGDRVPTPGQTLYDRAEKTPPDAPA